MREIREVADGVRISTDTDSWTFDRVIVASGFGSGAVLPPFLQRHVHPKRLLLTWFAARDTKQFVPEAFPIFIRITGDRSLYGTPTVDGVTVKATLDGRGTTTRRCRHHRSRAHGRRGRRVGRHGPGVPAGSGPRDRPVGCVPRPLDVRLDRSAGAAAGQRPYLLRDRVLRRGLQDVVGLRGDRGRRGAGPGSARRKAWTSFVRRASALPTEIPTVPAHRRGRRRSPASVQDLDDPAGVALDVVRAPAARRWRCHRTRWPGGSPGARRACRRDARTRDPPTDSTVR